MPGMKSNAPMKNDYVSGLEDRLAKKVKKAGRAFSQAADTGMGMATKGAKTSIGMATKGAKEVAKRIPFNPLGYKSPMRYGK